MSLGILGEPPLCPSSITYPQPVLTTPHGYPQDLAASFTHHLSPLLQGVWGLGCGQEMCHRHAISVSQLSCHSSEPRMCVGGQGTAVMLLACLSSPFKATQTRSHRATADQPSQWEGILTLSLVRGWQEEE